MCGLVGGEIELKSAAPRNKNSTINIHKHAPNYIILDIEFIIYRIYAHIVLISPFSPFKFYTVQCILIVWNISQPVKEAIPVDIVSACVNRRECDP